MADKRPLFQEKYTPAALSARKRAAFREVKPAAAALIGVGPEHEDFAKKIVALRKNPLVNQALAAGQGLGESIENITKTLQKGMAMPEPLAKEARAEGLIGEPWKAPGISKMQLARPTIGAKVAKVAGQVPAYLAAEEAMPLSKAQPFISGAKALEKSVVPWAERIAPKALAETEKFGKAAGVAGAFQEPKTPVTGAVTGFGGGLIGGAVPGAIAGVPRFAKNMLRGALRKGYSNEMFPYFKGRVNDILKDLQGTSSAETSNRDLFDRVARNYAEKEGHSADIHGNPITEETAQYTKPSESVGSEYDKARALSQETPYKFNAEPLRKALGPESRKMATDIERYKEAPLFRKDTEEALDLMKNVRNTRLQTFDDADSLKRTLNNLLFEKDVPKSVKSSLYNVKKGLLKSTEDTYKSNPKLYKIWRGADERYKGEIVPFLETRKGAKSPFIKAHTGDAEIVDKFGSNYIKPNSPDLLNNFMKIIPDADTRKLAAYDYLKRSGTNESVDNPTAFINQAKKLSPSQLKTLAPEHAEEIKNMIELQKKVPRAFKVPKEEIGGLAKMLHFAPHLMTGAAAYGATRDLPLAAASMLIPAAARKSARGLLKTAAGRKFFMEEVAPRMKGLLSRLAPAARGAGAIGATSALSQLRGKQ